MNKKAGPKKELTEKQVTITITTSVRNASEVMALYYYLDDADSFYDLSLDTAENLVSLMHYLAEQFMSNVSDDVLQLVKQKDVLADIMSMGGSSAEEIEKVCGE